MSISFVSSVGAGCALGSSNAITTGSIDTTGANFLLVVIAWDNLGATPAVTDSKSNSYAKLTTNSQSNHSTSLFYAVNVVVGTNHTFTCTSANGFSSIVGAAFFGVTSISPVDQQNGSNSSLATSLATGSATPSQANELLVAGLGVAGVGGVAPVGISINSSFSTPEVVPFLSAAHYGVNFSYLIQSAAAAVNPTWSWTNNAEATAEIATFKASTDGPNLDSWGPALPHYRPDPKSVVGY